MQTLRSFAAAALVTLPLFACGKGKVDQCNDFIGVANTSQTVISSLALDSDDPAKLEAEAAKIDGEAKKVSAVDLKDEKLAAFRNDYAANLTKLAKNVRDLGALAKNAKDPNAKGLEAQLKKLEADGKVLEDNESKVVDQVNVYCTGSK
jgi:hypothetical protein